MEYVADRRLAAALIVSAIVYVGCACAIATLRPNIIARLFDRGAGFVFFGTALAAIVASLLRRMILGKPDPRPTGWTPGLLAFAYGFSRVMFVYAALTAMLVVALAFLVGTPLKGASVTALLLVLMTSTFGEFVGRSVLAARSLVRRRYW